MKKIYFPILMLSVLFFAGQLHAQIYSPPVYSTQIYKTESTNDDSIRHIVLKPTILQGGATLFVEPYRKQPFILSFFNVGGARVGTYLVRDNSFYINTSGWGKGMYFYSAADAFHRFIDSGKILVL